MMRASVVPLLLREASEQIGPAIRPPDSALPPFLAISGDLVAHNFRRDMNASVT